MYGRREMTTGSAILLYTQKDWLREQMNQSDIVGSTAIMSKAWSLRYCRIKAISFPWLLHTIHQHTIFHWGSHTTIVNVHLRPIPRLNIQLLSCLIVSPDEEAGTTLS